MITRLVVLVLVVSLALLAIRVVERSKGRRHTGLAPGLLLVTSHGCTLCGPAQQALEAAGVDYRMVDAAAVPELGIRSVPTLFLVDGTGSVIARRSGRAAIVAESQLAAWRS